MAHLVRGFSPDRAVVTKFCTATNKAYLSSNRSNSVVINLKSAKRWD
jgi:hypothetical protein